ncbi:MAG: hypothetical protein ICV70_06490 [Jiangellaceae bacterium]|nr:hypothetical protein [Jiangellaceae bacterium]
MTEAALPDLIVGLVSVRDPRHRPDDERATGLGHIAEVTAIVHNRGDGLAEETTTRFRLRGPDIDRELRAIYTPPIPPGEEVEVTATWDIRGRFGRYELIVTADAFSQIHETRTDNNSATLAVSVQGVRVEPI